MATVIFVSIRIYVFNSNNSLTNNPSMELQSKIKFILNSQATTTGFEALDDPSGYSTPSRPHIIHTIATSFTFMGDMGKAKGLIKSNQSLLHSLKYTKQLKHQFFFVYIPTLHFHLVDDSDFTLPVKL